MEIFPNQGFPLLKTEFSTVWRENHNKQALKMGGKVNNVIYTNEQVTATGSLGFFLQWASECCCGTCFLVKFTERSGVWSTYLSSPIHCQLKVLFRVVTPWTFASDVLEKRVLRWEVGSACDEYHWQVGEELICMGRSYSLLKPCYKSIFSLCEIPVMRSFTCMCILRFYCYVWKCVVSTPCACSTCGGHRRMSDHLQLPL